MSGPSLGTRAQFLYDDDFPQKRCCTMRRLPEKELIRKLHWLEPIQTVNITFVSIAQWIFSDTYEKTKFIRPIMNDQGK